MRDKLQTPWWVWSLIQGVFFGAAMTVFYHLQHSGSGWNRAIFSGVLQGVFFGAVMGPFIARQLRRVSAVVGNLPTRDIRAAARAVNRGHPPQDPQIRRAAERLAIHRLKQLSRVHRLGMAGFLLVVVGSAVLAFASSPWWWIAVCLSAANVVAYLLWPGHLRRRIEILKSETDDHVIIPDQGAGLAPI